MFVLDHLTKGCGGKGTKILNTMEKNGLPVGPITADGMEDTTATIDKGATTCPNAKSALIMGCLMTGAYPTNSDDDVKALMTVKAEFE